MGLNVIGTIKFEVCGYELVPEGPVQHARWLGRLADADRFDLTSELFWGELLIVVGNVRFGGYCHLLDMVIGWHAAGEELGTKAKFVFRAAEGAGDYTFRLRGEQVHISLSRGPKADVQLVELRHTAAVAGRMLVRDIIARFPALKSNEALREIAGRFVIE